MANYVIAPTQTMDLSKLITEAIAPESGLSLEQGSDMGLEKETFAQVIEQGQAATADTSLVDKMAPFKEALSVNTEIESPQETLGLEAIFNPVPLDGIVYRVPLDGIVYRDRSLGNKSSPEILSDDGSVQRDSVLDLVATEVPTAPVLKVLSKELPAEDLEMYIPKDNVLVARQAEPQLGLPAQAKPLDNEPAPLVQLKGLEQKPDQSPVEKVTFVPGNQAEAKPEPAPKFAEILQNVTVKEEVVKAVITKTDKTTHKDASINKPMTDTALTSSDKPQVADNQKITPPLEIRETKPGPRNLNLKADLPADNEPRIEPIANYKLEAAASQESASLKAQQTSLTPQLLQAKTPQIMHDIAVHMKQAINASSDKVTVQLNPPALGKIQIELQFAKDGRVNAILYADKIETYDLLQRNPQLLKESIAGTGINPETTDLSFSFRGENSDRDDGKTEKPVWGNSQGMGESSSEAVLYRQSTALNSDKKVDIHA